MTQTIVVQYVPDAVMNERINIGVVVLEGEHAESRFLTDWSRVKTFAGKEIAFLRELERDAESWDANTVRRLTSQWTGSVQFSEPKFTLLNPENAMIDGLRRYLFARRPSQKPGYRDKSAVVRLIKKTVKDRLIEVLGPVGRQLIKANAPELEGVGLPHQFDVSVSNGRPLFAAQGISFEIPSERHLEKEVRSTAYLVQDVRALHQDLPIGVVLVPPRKGQPIREDLYPRARKVFQDHGATLLSESEVSEWSYQQSVALLPEYGPPS